MPTLPGRILGAPRWQQSGGEGRTAALIYDDHYEWNDRSFAYIATEYNGTVVAINTTVGLNLMQSGSIVQYGVAVGLREIVDAATEQVFQPFFFQFISGGNPANYGGGNDPDDDEGPDDGADGSEDIINTGDVEEA